LFSSNFKKKGSTWYRETSGALQVLDLQKSNFGGQFYINLCLVPSGMAVEGAPTPKAHKCPISIRIGSLFGDDRKEAEDLLNLEFQDLSPVERELGIKRMLERVVTIFFDRLTELSDLKLAIEQGMFKRGAVTVAARNYLGLEK
jgi:hypothetical protein